MSHFATLVTGSNPSAALQPFHEYECTGVRDKHVVDVDETAEMRERFTNGTIKCLKAPDGVSYKKSEEQFFRRPTAEEIKNVGPWGFGSCGHSSEVGWYESREWSDGSGYSARIAFIPEGYEEVERPFSDFYTFASWMQDYQSYEPWTLPGAPSRNEKDVYSFFTVGEHGEVTGVYRRTNPNKKWDWWKIGGRYSNRLTTKTGELVDECTAGELDLQAMAAQDISFFAFLHDGEWKERGEMGWWGFVSNEQDATSWKDGLYASLAALPPETQVTVVDCHI